MRDDACSDLRLDRIALVGRPRKLHSPSTSVQPGPSMVMTNLCTAAHHVRGALRTGWSLLARPAGRAAFVSRSRRRRSRLRARARGRARSSPTACRPRTTSAQAPVPPSLQGSCPASSSSLGFTRRGRSLGIAQRSQRNAEREDGPGGVVLRHPRTCRWGPWSSSEARSAPCRSSPSSSASVVVASVVGSVSVVTLSTTVVVAGCVVVVDSVTVVVDADVVPGAVSVSLGRVGSVTDPVGRVTLLSAGSPEPSPAQPLRR